MVPRTHRLRGLRLGLGACVATLVACGGDEPADPAATDAVESIEATATEGTFLLAAAEGLLAASPGPGVLLTPARVAAFVAARIAGSFRPAGCASATSSGGSVRLTLRDCAAGFELGPLNGTVLIGYEVTRVLPVELAVTLRSDALAVAGARFEADVDAAVSYDRASTTWQVVARTRSAGTWRRGVPFTRAGDFTLRWEPEPRCAAVDGTWSTTSGAASARTQVTGLRSCMGRCPQVGGVAVFTSGSPPDPVTITYTGSATAQWRRASGAAGTVALSCEN